jgi:phospholipid/cholesterol/gamma-HCH transport system substrate-binding protein
MRRAIAAIASAATALGLSGCGLGAGLYNVPLPGGADLGSHPYTVTVQFRDALDLVPQSGVKVNDVAVGRVNSISLESNGRIADVKVEVNGNVRLPANAVASVQQTSLLGEKYVALAAPLGEPAAGVLGNGAVIGVARTTDGVEVEQVFGALSLLLNGGGISQLNEISRELDTATAGHEAEIRRFLASSQEVVARFNAHRREIADALDALAQLSRTLRSDDSAIARVLQSFAPGIAELARQRNQLIGALTALNQLSNVTVQTLRQSKANILADLRALAPILSHLAAAGTALPQSLQVLLTYPFTDGAVQAIKGDYLNTFVTTDLNTPGGTAVAVHAPTPAGHTAEPGGTAPPSGLLPPTSASAPGLPATLPLAPRSTSGAR